MTGDPRRRPKADIRQAFLAPVTPIRNGPTPRTPPSVQRSADRRNGLPEVKPYVWHRDAQVAARIQAAQQRADALPGAAPRCPRCGKPAPECAASECLTKCPEHGFTLYRNYSYMACPQPNCGYEAQPTSAMFAELMDGAREAEIAAYQAEVTRLRDELLAEREAEIAAELDAIRALRNQGETT